MEIDIVGIDLAKQVFQLHGADRRGRVLHRAKVSRGSLFESVRMLKPRLIVMEACSSAHHWARRFQSLGTEVRLISPPCKIRFRSRTLPGGRSGAVVRSDPQPVVRGASKACGKTLGKQRSHARTKNTGASPRRTMARNSQRRL
jgi:transposase